MAFYIAFFLLISWVLLVATIIGKDFYPFSHYPMFSGLNYMAKVKVYRLALEAQNGEIEWWQHEAYNYPDIAGRKLYLLNNELAISNKTTAILITLRKHKLLLEVLRLIEHEKYTRQQYRALHIVERTVSKNFEILDKTIEIISFADLKNGRVS